MKIQVNLFTFVIFTSFQEGRFYIFKEGENYKSERIY